MSEYSILHNPRCSKSRQTLALLEENGISPEIILYLQDGPSLVELQAILEKLAVPVRSIIRSGEAEYKELALADSSLSDEQLLQALVKCPKLIERPIVIKGDKAVIGRPPENVLRLL
jgi:arsenate reductase